MTMNEATLFQPESLKKYSTTNPAIPIELPITTTLQFEQPGKKDQHSFDVLNTTTQKCLPLSSAAFLLDQQPCYNNLLPSGSNMENMPVNNLALNAFDQQQEIAINEFDDFLLHQLTQNDMDILLSLVPNVIAASDSDAVIDSIIELPLEYCQPKKKTHFSTDMEQIELIENNFISESSLQQQQQDNVISSGSIDWQNISAALLERELQSDDNREYQSGTRLEEAKQQPSLPDEEANFSCPSEEEKEDMNGSSQGEFGIRTCLWANCEEKFDHLQALVSHLSEIHMGRGKSTYRCEWKDCARIDNPFTKRHKMYAHLRIHTGERPFVCPKPGCNKQFTRPDSLTNHIKTHSKVRPFICRWKGCGKAYFYSRSLKKHEKIHEDAEQMPYQIESITQPYLQLQQSDLLARNANPVFVPLYQSSLDFTNCQTSKLL